MKMQHAKRNQFFLLVFVTALAVTGLYYLSAGWYQQLYLHHLNCQFLNYETVTKSSFADSNKDAVVYFLLSGNITAAKTTTDEIPLGAAILSVKSWATPTVTALQNIGDLDTDTRYITGSFDISPGLGNLMFVYASLKAIAIRYEAQVIVPEDSSLRHAFFKLDAVFVTRQLYEQLKNLFGRNSHNFGVCCKFYKTEEQRLFMNQSFEIVYGYMQSYRYFHPYMAKFIRFEFTFLPEIISQAKALLTKVKLFRTLQRGDGTKGRGVEVPVTYIGVHVRHGADITGKNQHTHHGHKAVPAEYILHAMDYFRHFDYSVKTLLIEGTLAVAIALPFASLYYLISTCMRRSRYDNAVFVFVSDDQNWTRSILNETATNDVFFVSTGFRETDMATLTLCNHTIMSTGTFSWWTAYLTGGTTTYYRDWPAAGSDLEKIVTKTDFFPKTWISMT